MDNHAANPAGRLLLYFNFVQARSGNERSLPIVAEYFGLPAKVSPRFLMAMAELMRAPDEVEARVAQIEDPPLPAEKLTNPLRAVRKVFTDDPLAKQSVQWVTAQITPQIRSELETTSYVLNKYVTTRAPISEDSLDDIRKLAEEIIELANADEGLDAETRAAFVRHANRITEAADLSKVAGGQPLIDELDRFHQETRRLKTAPGEGLWEKTKQLTAVVVLTVELFTVPVNVHSALEYYGDPFEQRQITEAPGAPTPDIIDVEVVEDEADSA